jgi:hypothetical protein
VKIGRPQTEFVALDFSPAMMEEFRGRFAAEEDRSYKLLGLETQLAWLREIGFADVDCHWKWRELALLAGIDPAA